MKLNVLELCLLPANERDLAKKILYVPTYQSLFDSSALRKQMFVQKTKHLN